MTKQLYFSLFLILVCRGLSAQSPSIGGYNVYYGTLHNHSSVSDGTGTPDQAYNYAKNNAGYDFFSLADHQELIDSAEWVSVKTAAEKYNQDSVFTTFWGFERSTNGHVAVINSDDYPAASDDPYSTFEELVSWVNARNCIAFFNHPGRTTSILFSGFTTTPSEKFVGMELWNGTADFSMHYYNDGMYRNDGNLNHYAEANSRGWMIGASGSDDNHGGTWGTRTGYRLAILSEHLTRADLYAAMQARRFFSTLDKNLALSFKINGMEMGSVLEGKPYDLQIQASDKDGEIFTKVMLFRNGFEIKTWFISTPLVNLTLPIKTYDGDFIHVKVTQADGNEAISSPVFIRGGAVNSLPSCSISAPLNGIHLDDPQSITISAEASDTDGSVVAVKFSVNNNSLGTDSLAPYSIDYNIPSAGPYTVTAEVTDDAGSRTFSSPVGFTVGTFSGSRSSRISGGNDDIEESATGIMDQGSSDLELVTESTIQKVGLRFTGLEIPAGASIESAYIQFAVDEVSSGSCSLSIRGHNADNSEPFTTADFNVSGRSVTSAVVTWAPPVWPTVGAAGPDQKTPDLSSIIQEIVNRPGYTSGSAVSIIITGTGKRVAEAYEGSESAAALLTVDYSFGTETSILTSSLPGHPVQIYPNPVSDGKITVEINSDDRSSVSVTIFDLSGRILHRSVIGSNQTIIDVSDIKSGLYIIQVSDGIHIRSHKMIVK
jgi:hypothetical protein